MEKWKIGASEKEIFTDRCRKINDDIEMSGFYVSDIVCYGTNNEGTLYLSHHPVFPMLRMRPNDTVASFQADVPPEAIPDICIDGVKARQIPVKFTLDGTLRVDCLAGDGITVTHVCYPSCEMPACYEMITLENNSGKAIELQCGQGGITRVCRAIGCMGINLMEISTSDEDGIRVTVPDKGEYSFAVVITGRRADRQREYGDFKTELANRYESIRRYTEPFTLDTGNATLNTMFYFAKIRAAESVFKTKAGLLHSPGGRSYYAAVWCNDQAEYSGTWFPYTGDSILTNAAYNAYRLYIPFMDNTYEPIPSSIIAEGVDYWNGSGDRGDAAMYLYGASYFALSCGNREYSDGLWGAIKWCAEYCSRKTTAEGVIASDSDELEGRLPSGDRNLSTSALCYGGLLLASRLAKEYGETDTAAEYEKRADTLGKAIESYFGDDIHGFHTYRYYDGNTCLRSWICLPVCMGILNRADDTTNALLSDRIMTKDGLLSAEGESIVWDRSTLYALRGFFKSGATDKAADILLSYSEKRLTENRVPYAVEAYPEGGRRHLSGESSLYCKIFTDGILGIVPTGFSSFEFCLRLPSCLDRFNVQNIRAFGHTFSIKADCASVTVTDKEGGIIYTGIPGERVEINL